MDEGQQSGYRARIRTDAFPSHSSETGSRADRLSSNIDQINIPQAREAMDKNK